ncbi:uncharacterized protein LOC125857842 isoform X3 [Solanum stenotomum]|uniref:uncharacterized protein LOC125857842 isoform X1 n=1 Tax=Solanum stenotomum TaxID=172797 RepID=UPI0020D13260|nr:uncharacterized protein LOC125857842 isoform X1 [Solanum stenotomum]XP_049393448.1 uncharacterized protein LOC125857842 isoform X2 [Solanum stenotomum]XP_049393449.1 uncharacterized protein LOC125857842 isoform X2 [Solanum stenotomum]XP_049393450.1 uncharacterized protein LOC125857842 isoform X3 [Solanum stenotomum]
MEASAAAGVAAAAAARGVALPVSSAQAARKEWRAVSEQSVRNSGSEETERSRLGQSDERLIYEVQQGREPVDVDFCSITIDGTPNNDILQQRLLAVVKQKEEFHQMEVELRAQLFARSEIMEIRNSFDAQIKEHVTANVKLQDQIHERDQRNYELERRMEEKERELNAIRLDHEAAWAKEDLLREQSKELQTYRRERDNSEAERAQHIKQIHDLQEHIQEKERQFIELQEQHRIAQETILFKDEQIREAQTWMTRVQEFDAVQQGELRERTEQYNQLWLAYQRQFGEMERLHMHMQQLQLELAEARGGTYSEGSQVSNLNTKDASHLGQNNGSQLNASGSSTPGESSIGLQNGTVENAPSFASTGHVSTQSDHVHGMPVAPSSLLGMTTYLPPGQIAALHPYVMHQQGIPPPLPSHVPQSHVGHFHSVPAVSSLQHWPNQQAAPEGSQISNHNQYTLQPQSTLPRSDSQYDHETTVNGQSLLNVNQGIETQDSVVPASSEDGQELQSVDKNYLSGVQAHQTLHQISSQFNGALRLDSHEHNNETEVNNVNSSANYMLESQGLRMGEFSSNADKSSAEISNNVHNSTESVMDTVSSAVLTETYVAGGQKNAYAVGKSAEVNLLDEKALLACIVRTIPPGSGGRIRISSTLPNRLGKMLAPLHWHDYKKKYGKLDEFVANHPELFVIDRDFIQLRGGAQEIIAATAAAAKVAAAAAAPSSYSSLLPPIAVTPMPQNHRLKRVPSVEPTSEKAVFKDYAVVRPANSSDNLQSQISNGASFKSTGGISNVKILTKPRDQMELNASEARAASSVQLNLGNGASADKNDMGSSQNKVSSHGRPGTNLVGRQGRNAGISSGSRR